MLAVDRAVDAAREPPRICLSVAMLVSRSPSATRIAGDVGQHALGVTALGIQRPAARNAEADTGTNREAEIVDQCRRCRGSGEPHPSTGQNPTPGRCGYWRRRPGIPDLRNRHRHCACGRLSSGSSADIVKEKPFPPAKVQAKSVGVLGAGFETDPGAPALAAPEVEERTRAARRVGAPVIADLDERGGEVGARCRSRHRLVHRQLCRRCRRSVRGDFHRDIGADETEIGLRASVEVDLAANAGGPVVEVPSSVPKQFSRSVSSIAAEDVM